MPSDSEPGNGGLRPLPAAPRYLRRNAARAMAGYLIRGLVELITNARDSAYRLLRRRVVTTDQLARSPIEIDYSSNADTRHVVLRDRFEGMTSEVMRDRLLQYGQSASEFESGASVRGLNARGAKDVGVLGATTFESICDGQFSECLIREGMYREPRTRRATTKDRERLGITEGNGTVVTLVPFPDLPMPHFDGLIQDLERHIEIRYSPDGLPRIPIVVHETRSRGAGKEADVQGFTPEGSEILNREIEIPEYKQYGPPARLTLYRSAEKLRVGSNSMPRLWRSEAGILVTDGRTAHDITFFRANAGDLAASQYLFGQLFVPQLVKLLTEFEEFERRRERDPDVSPPPLNPMQVTDPDRLGLNEEHPFVRALEERVRPLIQDSLATIQRELTPSAQERLNKDLRDALDQLGEQLADRLEMGLGGGGRGTKIPWGLSVIPAGIRLEISKAKRVGVYFRTAASSDAATIHCEVAPVTDAVRVATASLELTRVEDRPGVFRGSFEVFGVRLTDTSGVRISAKDQTITLKATVRDAPSGTVVLDHDLQFSQRRYTSVPGRRKHIEIFADESLDGKTVQISLQGDNIILTPSAVALPYDEVKGVCWGKLTAESSVEATGRLIATCGDLGDEADIVFEKFEEKASLKFTFTDREDFSSRRFQWDLESPNVVLIAAKHPTLKRVLGPDLDPVTNEQWPGQRAPQTRAIIAEVVAEAYVARRLERELEAGTLGWGPQNLVDPVDYEQLRYKCFQESQALCHEILTPPYHR